MNITEIIEKRQSCRTFQPDFLKEKDKEFIKAAAAESTGLLGIKAPLQLIENRDDSKEMKLNYGGIMGHNTYLLGTTHGDPFERISYGYQVEKLVLLAEEKGMASCWVGYFDKDFFNELRVAEGSEIPSIVILGYREEKPSRADRLSRMVVRASRRQPWEKMFFCEDNQTQIKENLPSGYEQILNMVQQAPSSGNSQPWRIFWDSQNMMFHFYKKVVNQKYEKMGIHDIDLGIAMAHFELTAEFLKNPGKWVREEGISRDSLEYCLSWKIEE